jgi:hypothetical protein
MATRILNIPVRATIRDTDSVTGSYPTIARTGDATRLGKSLIGFDDVDTVVFASGKTNLPQGLFRGGVQLNRQNTVNDFPVTGSVVPGVGDTLAQIKNPHPVDNLGPFVDFNKPEYQTSDFFLTGTSPDVLPSFSSPLKSKTIIRIDLSSSSDHTVTRNFSRRNDLSDPGGEFFGIDNSGFSYFNFVTKTWEDLGLFDPATGVDVGGIKHSSPDWAVELISSAPVNNFVSGTNAWCQQFTGPDMEPEYTDDDRLASTNLLYVGHPTITMQAPFANRYHATASQGLKLSNFIAHPFLLEKAVLTFESLEARRIQNWSSNTEQSPERFLDEYVFFLYRQQGTNNVSDSQLDVSGSQRYLICSASMCFYNDFLKQNDFINPHTDPFAPFHSPDFSHNFGLTDNPSIQTGSWVGPAELKMISATAGPFLPGFFRVTGSVDPDGFLEQNPAVLNYWPGGTTSRSFLTSSLTGRPQDAWSSPYPVEFGVGTYQNLLPASISSTAQSMDLVKLDNRAHAPLGRGGFAKGPGASAHRRTSPYLLMPEDSLIVGIDSLLGMRDHQFACELTGSYLKILGGQASLTLYGSLVRNNIEFHDTLNQPLTSEAVHEDLHFDNPTVDQYQVESLESYLGGTLDRVISGSIFDEDETSTRQVHASAIRNVYTSNTQVQGSIGSTTRASRHETGNEIYYDSIVPSLKEYIISGGGSKTASTHNNVPAPEGTYGYGDWDDPNNGITTLVFREPRNTTLEFSMPTPFAGNPIRIIDDKTALYTCHEQGPGLYFPQFVSGSLLRDLLFRRGQKNTAGDSNIAAVNKRYFSVPVDGATGFRYGLMGIEPTKSATIFRYDKYGQFRDMLEQRPFGRFFNNLGERRNIRGVSQRIGQKTGPITIRFMSGSTSILPSSAAQSSNISTVASSSLPYFDGISTN